MTIDRKFISELLDKALVNPRLRVNYDMRNTLEDGSQRLFSKGYGMAFCTYFFILQWGKHPKDYGQDGYLEEQLARKKVE